MLYSSDLKEIKEMVAVDRILEQIRGTMGLNDKVLAEFLLALAKQSPSAKVFEDKLREKAGGDAEMLASNLYALVTKLLPEYFPKVNPEDNQDRKETNKEDDFAFLKLANEKQSSIDN